MISKICFVAGEASGDRLASDVIKALKRKRPDLSITGVGGPLMANLGAATSEIDITPLSIVGLWEGVMAYRHVVQLAERTAAYILAQKPTCVILVDSWGFTLRVARRLRALAPDIHLIKLIGPQVWATRPGRAKTLARYVDHLLCIHGFETDYYHPYRLKTTVIGHPALSRAEAGNGRRFRQQHGLGDRPVLLLLPGSRSGEITRIGPVFVETAQRLSKVIPELAVAAAPAQSVRDMFYDKVGHAIEVLRVEGDEARQDAMAGATFALACSGTITSELARQGVPFLVAYKTGWITWAIARAVLLRTRYITLLNVAMGRDVVPEFVQTRATPGRLQQCAGAYLGSPQARAEQVTGQKAALAIMDVKKTPAAELAAGAILDDLKQLNAR